MTITGTTKQIVKTRNGEIWYLFNDIGQWKQATTERSIKAGKDLLAALRNKTRYETDKELYDQYYPDIVSCEFEESNVNSANDFDKVGLIQKIIYFFSEFHFEPNFRFLNTLAWNEKNKEGKEYIANYFNLIDDEYKNEISEKIHSTEFGSILSDMKWINPNKRINARFKLYYGSQGTGKTTTALSETNECMICHSAMLPQDLMEDFKFIDGKPDFKPSALYQAMIEGKKIVLDEINLLPFESLRFLQSILDGKESFTYKGREVRIKDGFEIIGTMNLVVNGCTYSLPAPLIDRAYQLKEFKLTAKDLVSAFD